MSKFKTSTTLKQNGKFWDLYLKNVPVYFAAVHKPNKKYSEPDLKDPKVKNSSLNEYQITAFVDDETREILEDKFLINKELKKVGVDKNKRRAIKYKLSSQLKDGEKISYDPVDGMYGIQLTLNEYYNDKLELDEYGKIAKRTKGKKANLVVVDSKGQPFEEDIGNMSICHIKCSGYKNRDDQLVVSLNMVVVVEHVPYEGGSGGKIVDEEFGFEYEIPQAKEAKKADDVMDFDDDIPFDVEDGSNIY